MQSMGRAGLQVFQKILICTVFILSLVACGFTPTPRVPAASSLDTPTPYTPFPGETPLATLTPIAECRFDSGHAANLLPYINTSEHYCFLYPGAFTVRVDPYGTLFVQKQQDESTKGILPAVRIENTGSTGGLGLQEWATKEIGTAEAPGSQASTFIIQVGDKEAIATDDLPGTAPTRVVYVVHSGDGFVITIIPLDGPHGAETLDLWETIRDSFVFFSP